MIYWIHGYRYWLEWDSWLCISCVVGECIRFVWQTISPSFIIISFNHNPSLQLRALDTQYECMLRKSFDTCKLLEVYVTVLQRHGVPKLISSAQCCRLKLTTRDDLEKVGTKYIAQSRQTKVNYQRGMSWSNPSSLEWGRIGRFLDLPAKRVPKGPT
jgi:hypothetical protein